MNPLLDFAGLPRFDVIQPTDVQPAISQLLTEARAEVERLLDSNVPATWNDFAQPLQDNLERLSRAWGIVGHLHSVNDIPPWREAYNDVQPKVSAFFSGIPTSAGLWRALEAFARDPAHFGAALFLVLGAGDGTGARFAGKAERFVGAGEFGIGLARGLFHDPDEA